MKLRHVLLFACLLLGATALTRTAAAKPLILDLGQGLAYHRAHSLPADLPAASPARPQPLVLDLRYTTGGPDAAITLAAWLKFRAVPRTPVFILANAETSPALRAAFAEREDTPGLIVLGLNGPDFTPDLALTADPAPHAARTMRSLSLRHLPPSSLQPSPNPATTKPPSPPSGTPTAPGPIPLSPPPCPPSTANAPPPKPPSPRAIRPRPRRRP
jgi:hypothetical protein